MHVSKLLGLILFVFILPLHAAEPVWKISKAGQHLYIGGTIHVLSQSDYPLPTAFETAYKQAATIVFETDTVKLQTPVYQQKMMQGVVYSDGRSLKSVLSAETFAELEKYAQSRGVPIANLIPLKAGMAAMTITMIELQRLGLLGTGVDDFYQNKAMGDGKKVGELETVDQQLEFIFGLGEGQEDDFVKYTLRDVKEIPVMMADMKEAWRKGNMKELGRIALTPLKEEFPKIYDSLLVKRNNAWLPQIKKMLRSKEVELILVGALHLVGDDGLLQQLGKQGYKVQQL